MAKKQARPPTNHVTQSPPIIGAIIDNRVYNHRQVDTLTETIEELQREAAVRERMLEANLSEMNSDMLRRAERGGRIFADCLCLCLLFRRTDA